MMDYMKDNYFCTINEKKLTEAEWEEIHKDEVENHTYLFGVDEDGYWHCSTFEAYSTSFDKCMAEQIERRDDLRRWYLVLLHNMEYGEKWEYEYTLFSDIYKYCFGVRPNLRDTLIEKKGIPAEVVEKTNAEIDRKREIKH